jgi:hypothetical protein
MAVISKGQTFAAGDQVTASKLNNLADNATFTSGAVDNTSTQLSGGAIIVKDGGVTTAKLNDGAVTTAKIADANVTTAKIADSNVTTAKIADANVTTTKIADSNVTTAKIADSNVTFAKLADVIDDDTMATATDTTLATSESIKAYVDASSTIGFSPSSYTGGESVTLPNGLIMKFGSSSIGIGATQNITFGTAFTSAISAQLTILNSSTTLDFFDLRIGSLSSSVLSVVNSNNFSTSFYWMVIGR